MAQPCGGGTLAESIAADLAEFTYPPDVPRLRPALEAIRSRIRQQADFDAAGKTAIIAALGGFADDRKIRFRSSTNVEDSAVFSGAGLYDSYSGCLVDDTDGDDVGPSHCDPDQPNERGVFRAIRKVYASFYNENAFIERLRHGIDESQVGMAVLVHYSFPDEIELANGVATLEIGKPADGPRIVSAQLVSQTGAVSITSPNTSFLPEVVHADYHGTPDGAEPTVMQRSALVGEGESVLEWTGEYTLGVPMLEGSPAFIWKTPILDEWGGTTVTGLTTEPLVITDRFSQTYKPGHHNFIEDFWIEPALIPGLPAETLRELRDANIRFIVATHPRAFPESPSTMRLVGFDLKVR